MSALVDRFATARDEGRAVLLGYLPVGFPSVDDSIAAMEAMVEAGVDVVEIGIPYSDPVLDGPIIEKAGEAALKAGVRVKDVVKAATAVTKVGAVPIVMTYYNPILQYGLDRFAADLAASGGVGVITPDLTPDVGEDWISAAEKHGLDHIFLVAPSTTPERLDMTVKASTGFVYATSLMGVTGERSTVSKQAEVLVKRTREAGAEYVCIGLGVSTGDQAAEVAGYADGVIVGTALVRTLVDAPTVEEGLASLRAKAAELAEGVRAR